MPTMVMPRNFVVRTIYGHVLEFRKNEPIQVPQDLRVIEECMTYGAVHVDEAEEAEYMAPKDPDSNIPNDPIERVERIRSLMKGMRDNENQHRGHFTAGNRPAVKYVTETLGFEVSADEIKTYWGEVIHGGK